MSNQARAEKIFRQAQSARQCPCYNRGRKHRKTGYPMNRRNLLQALAATLASLPIMARTGGRARTREIPRKILILRTRLAGFHYHEGPALLDRLQPGQRLDLVREPANPHDSDAVRIDWHGHSLGYVPRHHNYAPARLLDNGEPLRAGIRRLDHAQDPWRPVEIDVFLKLPVAISAGNAG